MTDQKKPPDVEVRLPTTGPLARLSHAVDRLAVWLAQHWLALFNALVAVFVGLPFLAPVLMHVGAAGPARVIYAIYAPTCHQLPERSFFLFGPRGVYTELELETQGEIPAGLNIFQRQALRFIGTPETGYKVAICERDTAIYGAILVSGLLFGVLRTPLARRRARLPKMPLWMYVLVLLPAAVDGGSQLVGLRESTWLLRLITGGLFGAGTVWLAYPYVQEAMADVLKTSAPNPEKQTPPNWTKTAP